MTSEHPIHLQDNLYLTEALQESLDVCLDQWKSVVSSRNISAENSMDVDLEVENLSASQLDNPNPYFSDDDDEEVQYFSLEASEKSRIFRSLYQWTNNALRSAKILHQSISKGTKIPAEKVESLMKELKPPNNPEAAKIPILTKTQLSDDIAVSEYVVAVKKYRFIWMKCFSTQKRQLKAGFEFEQKTLSKIGHLSIHRLIPLIVDHLQRSYSGAHKDNDIQCVKLDLLRSFIDSPTSPSRPCLHEPLWQLIISFVKKDPKILDVITTTPESKSCTLLDFKVALLYKEAFSYLPTSTVLISEFILYLKRRLSPSRKQWDYLPTKIIPKLLLYHLEWIAAAGFALDSAPIWTSTIDIHIRTKKFDIAAKLLQIVQTLPVQDIRSILNLANNAELREAFPDLRTISAVPSALLSRIKLRETSATEMKKLKNAKNSLELKNCYDSFQSMIEVFIEDYQHSSNDHKQLQLEYGLDPILFLYHEAFLKFSVFTNQMEYSMKICRTYTNFLLQKIQYSESQQVPEAYRAVLHFRLKEILLRLKEFSAYPNSMEIELMIAAIFIQILPEMSKQKENNDFLANVLCELLQGFQTIFTSQVIGSLIIRLVALARPETQGSIEKFRCVFLKATNSCSSVLLRTAPCETREKLLVRTKIIWNAWIQLEKRFSQFNQVMKCYEGILSDPNLFQDVEIWKEYANFCVTRKQINNVRVILCRAIHVLGDSQRITILKYFLEFEQSEGGNPGMTMRALVALIKQKTGKATTLSTVVSSPASPTVQLVQPPAVHPTIVCQEETIAIPVQMQPQSSTVSGYTPVAPPVAIDPLPATVSPEEVIEASMPTQIPQAYVTVQAVETTNLPITLSREDKAKAPVTEKPKKVSKSNSGTVDKLFGMITSLFRRGSATEIDKGNSPTIVRREIAGKSSSSPVVWPFSTPLTGIGDPSKNSSTKESNPNSEQETQPTKRNSNTISGKKRTTPQNQNNRKKYKRNHSDPPVTVARQHDVNFQLDETLAQALVHPNGANPAPTAEEAEFLSLLALEEIQQELLRNTTIGPNPNIGQTSVPNQSVAPNAPLITRQEFEQLTTVPQTPNLPTVGRTILLPDIPQTRPTFMQTMIGQYFPQPGRYPARPPLLSLPSQYTNQNSMQYGAMDPRANVNATQHSQTIENVNWNALLQDESILAIVRHLYELQELTEQNNDKYRRQLQREHREEERRLLSENTRRLNNARSSNEYSRCKSDNIHRISNFRKYARKQILEYDERVKQSNKDKIREQQITLQQAGIPGFFVTDDEKCVQVQTQILSMLFKIGTKISE